MAIEYLGLSEVNGPLVILEGVRDAAYEEIVEFHMDDGATKLGRIIEIYEEKPSYRCSRARRTCRLSTPIPD